MLAGAWPSVRKNYVWQVMKVKTGNYSKYCALLTPWGPALFRDSVLGSRGREGAAVTSALSCQLVFRFDLSARRECGPSLSGVWGEARPPPGLRRTDGGGRVDPCGF